MSSLLVGGKAPYFVKICIAVLSDSLWNRCRPKKPRYPLCT